MSSSLGDCAALGIAAVITATRAMPTRWKTAMTVRTASAGTPICTSPPAGATSIAAESDCLIELPRSGPEAPTPRRRRSAGARRSDRGRGQWRRGPAARRRRAGRRRPLRPSRAAARPRRDPFVRPSVTRRVSIGSRRRSTRPRASSRRTLADSVPGSTCSARASWPAVTPGKRPRKRSTRRWGAVTPIAFSIRRERRSRAWLVRHRHCRNSSEPRTRIRVSARVVTNRAPARRLRRRRGVDAQRDQLLEQRVDLLLLAQVVARRRRPRSADAHGEQAAGLIAAEDILVGLVVADVHRARRPRLRSRSASARPPCSGAPPARRSSHLAGDDPHRDRSAARRAGSPARALRLLARAAVVHGHRVALVLDVDAGDGRRARCSSTGCACTTWRSNVPRRVPGSSPWLPIT